MQPAAPLFATLDRITALAAGSQAHRVPASRDEASITVEAAQHQLAAQQGMPERQNEEREVANLRSQLQQQEQRAAAAEHQAAEWQAAAEERGQQLAHLQARLPLILEKIGLLEARVAGSRPRPSCSAGTQTEGGGMAASADSQAGAQGTIAGLRRELERSQSAVGCLKEMARQDAQQKHRQYERQLEELREQLAAAQQAAQQAGSAEQRGGAEPQGTQPAEEDQHLGMPVIMRVPERGWCRAVIKHWLPEEETYLALLPSGLLFPLAAADVPALRWSAGCLLGGTVSKRFDDGRSYEGKVTRYDKANGWYRIRYSDGDAEDLDEDEVLQVLQSRPPRKSGQASPASTKRGTRSQAASPTTGPCSGPTSLRPSTRSSARAAEQQQAADSGAEGGTIARSAQQPEQAAPAAAGAAAAVYGTPAVAERAVKAGVAGGQACAQPMPPSAGAAEQQAEREAEGGEPLAKRQRVERPSCAPADSSLGGGAMLAHPKPLPGTAPTAPAAAEAEAPAAQPARVASALVAGAAEAAVTVPPPPPPPDTAAAPGVGPRGAAAAGGQVTQPAEDLEQDAGGGIPPPPSTAPQRQGSSTSAPAQGSGNASGTARGIGGLAGSGATAAAGSSAGAAAPQQPALPWQGGSAPRAHCFGYSAAPYLGQPPLPGQEQQQQGSMAWMPYPAAAASNLDPAAAAAAASYGASLGKALAAAHLGQQQHHHQYQQQQLALPPAAGWGGPRSQAAGGGQWGPGAPSGAAPPSAPLWPSAQAADTDEPLQFRRLPEEKQQLVLEFGEQWSSSGILQRPKELAIQEFEWMGLGEMREFLTYVGLNLQRRGGRVQNPRGFVGSKYKLWQSERHQLLPWGQ